MTTMNVLGDLLPAPDGNTRIGGVVVGIVTNNNDPDGLGRVKVRFPWLSDADESNWARVATLMAGKDRGLYFLPEVDDEVLVAFDHGQIDHPFILGALWNGKDTPPGSNSDGKNNHRVLKSRSGHTITLDDTEGEEKITIVDKTGKNTIALDSQRNAISIESDQDLTISAKGNLTLKSGNGEVAIACQTFSVQAQQKYNLKAPQGKVEADASLALTCLAGVNINSGALEVK